MTRALKASGLFLALAAIAHDAAAQKDFNYGFVYDAVKNCGPFAVSKDLYNKIEQNGGVASQICMLNRPLARFEDAEGLPNADCFSAVSRGLHCTCGTADQQGIWDRTNTRCDNCRTGRTCVRKRHSGNEGWGASIRSLDSAYHRSPGVRMDVGSRAIRNAEGCARRLK